MRRLVALPLVSLALVGCGGTGGDGGADPAASIPPGAIAYAELVVRPAGARRERMSALAGKVLRTGEPGKKIVELLEAAADEQGGYARDVEPWLGERIGVAGFPPGDARESQIVMAAAARDSGAAADAVERQAKREGDERASYRDVEYWVDGQGDAVAATGDTVLFAESEEMLRKAIDAAQGKALAGEDRFKKEIARLPKERAGAIFLDPRGLLALGAAGAQGQQAQALGLLGGALAPLAMAVLVEDDHVAIEARAREGAPSLSPVAATDLVGELPEDSVFAAGTPKLGETARGLVGRVGGAIGAAVIEGQLERDYGLSLERDLYSWVGDAAVFVRGTSPAAVEGGLVLEVLDGRTARRALPRLLGVLRLVAGVASRPVALGGADLAFELSFSDVPLNTFVALKGDRAVIARGRPALLDGLQPSSLGQSRVFGAAREVLDGVEPGLVLDAPAALALLAAADPGPRFARLKPYLDTLTVVSSGRDKVRSRTAVALE
jgi:hypothetical protein